MYDELEHNHIGLLAQAFTATTSTPTATMNHGIDDVGTVSAPSAGLLTIVQRELGLMKRGPLVFGSHADSVDAGGFISQGSLPTGDTVTLQGNAAGGAGQDGKLHMLSIGWRMSTTDKTIRQLAKATWPRPVLAPIYVANNGSASVTTGIEGVSSIVRNGPGDVTVFFRPAYVRCKAAIVKAVSSTVYACKISSADGTSIRVVTSTTGGVATDTDFVILAAMSKAYDAFGRGRHNILVPFRWPRIVCGRVTNTGGTYTIAIGGDVGGVDFSLTKNGTGDVSVTLSKPYLRAPVFVGTAISNRCQLKVAPTTSVGRFLISNAAGTATDDSFDFVAIGSDKLV